MNMSEPRLYWHARPRIFRWLIAACWNLALLGLGVLVTGCATTYPLIEPAALAKACDGMQPGDNLAPLCDGTVRVVAIDHAERIVHVHPDDIRRACRGSVSCYNISRDVMILPPVGVGMADPGRIPAYYTYYELKAHEHCHSLGWDDHTGARPKGCR